MPSGGRTTKSQKVTMKTQNGKTIKTTQTTETTVFPDGSQKVSTREEVEDINDSQVQGPPASSKGQTKSKPMNATGATSSAANAKPPQDMKGFIADVVKAHNGYRTKHGEVCDLKNNLEMNKIAQKWADHLAAADLFEHSDDSYKGNKLGENIAQKQSTNALDFGGQEATDGWYNEITMFDWKNKESTWADTGHFSQVVWAGSKEIGVGKAYGKKGKVYVVCNYLPAGNVMGHFDENIIQAIRHYTR